MLACVQPLEGALAQSTSTEAAAAASVAANTSVTIDSVTGLPMRRFSEAEIAAVAMPKTAFVETPLIEADYDKYFYFQRPDTSFDEAYADIIECDALSSGASYYGGGDFGSTAAFAQYGVLPSAIGGAIGSVIADAVFGSAVRRQMRRTNLRNCMGFKGYDRYGLEKDLWQDFNFEEGLDRENAKIRAEALLKQARVASGPAPQQKALGL